MAGFSRFGSGGVQLNNRPTHQSGDGLTSAGDCENPTINMMLPGGEKLRHHLNHNKAVEQSLSAIWQSHFVEPLQVKGKFTDPCTPTMYARPTSWQGNYGQTFSKSLSGVRELISYVASRVPNHCDCIDKYFQKTYAVPQTFLTSRRSFLEN